MYPTTAQAGVLNRTFGCVRVVWNSSLAWRRERYQDAQAKTTSAEANAYLTSIKTTAELVFLNEVSSVPLQQAVRHQQAAFTNYFAKRSRHPRYKSHNGRQSAEYTRSGFRYRDGELFLAKMDVPLEFVWSWPNIDPTEIDPTTVTVSRDADGRYFVSFAVDVADLPVLPPSGTVVGVDVGLTYFAVTSAGEQIANPRHLRLRERRLARYQRLMARKAQGSKNRAKAVRTVARQHAKVADARKNFLHQESTRLVRAHDVIVLEDLAVANMVRNRRLSKSISDVGWGTFRRMVQYKAGLRGRSVVVIDRWYPSSKTCSDCGHLLARLPLGTRHWTCPICGTRHDRDVNAAKNILAAGLAVLGAARNTEQACGAGARPQGTPLRQSVMKQETQLARAGIPSR